MTYLKLEDTIVMKFDLNTKEYEVINPSLLPFSLRDRIIDTKKNLQPDMSQIWFNNQELLSNFFYNRSLSVNRENAKYILNQLNIRQNNDFESRFKAMIMCKGLSVSDSYWITNNIDEKWAEVKLDSHPLHETLQQIALFGRSLTITGKLHTPELTTQGAYAKAWFRENSKLYLYKANSIGGNESEREVLASNILDCFNVPHVKYILTHKDNLTVCKCENMNLNNTSIIDSIEVETWFSKKGLNFFEEVKRIDSEMFFKTIVVDYLIANRDRHGGNWGFYMNNQNGKIICMHPLFDHNNAFDKNFMDDPEGGICQLLEGKTQKEAALYAIKHCDFRCIKPITKSMFFNDNMYKTFINRACELGLYKKQKLTFFDHFFNPEKQEYIPVHLQSDNTSHYWNRVKEGSAINNKFLSINENKKNINIHNIDNSTQNVKKKHNKINKDYDFDYTR